MNISRVYSNNNIRDRYKDDIHIKNRSKLSKDHAMGHGYNITRTMEGVRAIRHMNVLGNRTIYVG
jgi:hypothetical protein